MLEIGESLVRAEKSVETARSSMNHLAFFKVRKTIGLFAGERSGKIAVHVTVSTKRDGDN